MTLGNCKRPLRLVFGLLVFMWLLVPSLQAQSTQPGHSRDTKKSGSPHEPKKNNSDPDPGGTPGIHKMSGWISDAKCASRDSHDPDCTKKCIEAGERLVLVSDKNHTVYNIDNPDALKGHEGHHVSVTGANSEGTLHIERVRMLQRSASADKKSAHADKSKEK